MTKGVIQPLESYRLAQYVVPIPCYICETDNTYDAEFCTHCYAPMALAHQANSQDIRPRMVAVVGPSAVGKTVYLGMLMDMLSRQPEKIHLLARGAFSITLQQTTLSALSRCEFPAKTPNEPDRWNWVHCQIRRPGQRKTTELIMPDMAGEAILEEVDHPHSYRVIRAFLKKCTAALVLVDAARLREGSREQDYFTMKLLSYLSELSEDRKSPWADNPLAIVFTKADCVEECRRDPAAFAQAHAAGLWQHCRERFGRHRFFASGVAGTCAVRDSLTEGRVQVPLRIEPHGVTEPFEWVLEHILAKRG
jgi:hypothetical protein